jgi:hypothetical protein
MALGSILVRRCGGKSVNCGIEGMIETMVEGLDAFWNEFGVLTGLMGSGWSKQDSFEEEDQSEEGCRGVLGGGTKGGITAGGKFQDAKEREVTSLGGLGGGALVSAEWHPHSSKGILQMSKRKSREPRAGTPVGLMDRG